MSEILENDLPENAKSLWVKAARAVQASNSEYAVTLIQSVLEQAPGFLEGRKLLRKCAQEVVGDAKKKSLFGSMGTIKIQGQLRKNPAAAMALIEKGLAKDPGNPDLNDLLFEASIRLELFQTAAFALETVRAHSPENAKLLHKLASFYLEKDMPGEAVEVYNDIIKHQPNDGIAIKGAKDASARASMRSQKWDENSDMKSLMRNADQFKELEKSAKSGMTTEQLEERRDKAVDKYNADPNNLAASKELASIYEQLEDWHNAHTFYHWAHSLSSGDSALANKAVEMNDKAIEQDLMELEAAVEADPDNEELRQALQSRRADRLAEQIQEATQRVETNPTDPQLRFELGNVLYKAGQHSDAIPHLQQATRNPHIRTKVLLTLARCFKAKGMFDLAVKQLSDALADLQAMDGTKKEILYEKGIMHDEMGDKASALESFKQIYEVDYGYRDIAQRVESSYS